MNEKEQAAADKLLERLEAGDDKPNDFALAYSNLMLGFYNRMTAMAVEETTKRKKEGGDTQ